MAKHSGSLELQFEEICPSRTLILLEGVTYDWEHLICNNIEFDSVKHLQLFLSRQLTAVYACVGANSFARYLRNGRGTRTTPITPFIHLSGLINDRKHQDLFHEFPVGSTGPKPLGKS